MLSEDRLDLLRTVDHMRQWHTLDDKRVCAICARIVSGRQVDIQKQGRGYAFHCPSTDCSSDFRHWRVWRPAPAETASL
jgi:hypothetical protein